MTGGVGVGFIALVIVIACLPMNKDTMFLP